MNYERCHKYDLCSNAPDHYGKCDVSAHANAVLAEARRVSGDNADIAMKALEQLAECQQVLSELRKAAGAGWVMIPLDQPEHQQLKVAAEKARYLLNKQKEESK